MADGATHIKFLRFGWMIVIPLGLFLYLILELLDLNYALLYPLFFYANFLLCEIIDPDADHISITSSEGRILRITKKYYIGLFGAIFVAYGFMYAYLIGLVGGHRSFFSHGWIVGTIGRMLFYNAPLYFIFHFIYAYGIGNWGWTSEDSVYKSFSMDVWLTPYLISQFLAWFIGDGIHLILDHDWAKGKLYIPIDSRR
jgi:hypothetical protein